jgi:hypothetical protein
MRDHFLGGGLVNAGIARLRQVLRHVEQRLLLVVEMAGHHQRARVLQAQPLLGVVEAARHRQRAPSEHHRVHLVEQRSETMLDTSMGVACRKAAAPALFHPVDVPLVVLFHHEAQRLAEFQRAANSGMISSGGFCSSLRCEPISSSAASRSV